MSVSADDVRSRALDVAMKSLHPRLSRGESRFKAFLLRYSRHISDEDLAALDPAALAGLAKAHLALAQNRPVGTANVRVFNADPDRDGFADERTHVLVVTDDMPFLVDSISWELNRSGRIHNIVHPQLVVRRDAAGLLREVVELDEAPRGEFGVGLEAWIALDIDRIVDPAGLAELDRRLQGILGDVRDSVEDWPKMRARARSLAEELRAGPPRRHEPGAVAEAADFLDWLVADHFTFLGYREYQRVREGNRSLLRAVVGSGLGQFRYDTTQTEPIRPSTPEQRAVAGDIIVVDKDDARSTVHRSVHQDVIVVRTYDRLGKVAGEHRFVGLYTSSAFNSSIMFIPLVRVRVPQVLAASGYTPDSHTGRALVNILEGFPRDELIQTDAARLTEMAPAILRMKEHGRTGVFLRTCVSGRFLSALVYLPRDRYTTAVRVRVAELLGEATAGSVVDYTARVNEWTLARLHFYLRLPSGRRPNVVDIAQLERDIALATRSWGEDFLDAVRGRFSEAEAARLLADYADALPEAFKEDVAAGDAVDDLVALEAVRAGDTKRYELYRA